MGYMTDYSLALYGEPGAVMSTEMDVSAIDPQDNMFKELADYGFAGPMKWYDWESDMKRIARNHSDVLIILSGRGEDQDDIWEARFKGDAYEYHKAEIPQFTNKELLVS